MSQPVTFLIIDATGTGGLARAVVTVANQLANHRDVRVVSVMRCHETARYPLDPRIRHEVLIDEHAGLSVRQKLLRMRPTRLAPGDSRLSLLTDLALERWLRRSEPGIVVTTRPTLHLAATAWRRPGTQVVGWDHKNFPTRFAKPWLAAVLERSVHALDGYVVLTRADAHDYRRATRLGPGGVTVIRNPLSWPPDERPSALTERVVVAAGRLAPVKGFARMIDAFATVARKHPDWQLHIYGDGPRRPALQERIDRLGVRDQVRLMGYTDDMAGVLRAASAFAMTSKAEGFPMVLLEALSEGLPLVAMDCPRGPGEIVDHEVNGLLVDDGDSDGFTRALLAVIEDEPLRRRLGQRAHADASGYTADRIAADWVALLADLDARAGGGLR